MNNLRKIIALALLVVSLFAVALPAIAASSQCNHSTYGMSGSTLVKYQLLGKVMKYDNTNHWEAEKWQYKCKYCTELRQDATYIDVPGTKPIHSKQVLENYHWLDIMGRRTTRHITREKCTICSWGTPTDKVERYCTGCNGPYKQPLIN